MTTSARDAGGTAAGSSEVPYYVRRVRTLLRENALLALALAALLASAAVAASALAAAASRPPLVIYEAR